MGEEQTESAIDALRRGRAVRVTAARTAICVVAIEVSEHDADGADILVTDKRAATLGLVNQRSAAGMAAVRVARAPWLDSAGARAIVDPVHDLATPLKGPFETVPLGPALDAALAALQLAKHAGLLPALFILDGAATTATVDAAAIHAYGASDHLQIVTRARLPVKADANSEVVMFRARGGPEHLALMIGDALRRERDDAPPVRLHSACLTGDLLGSLKCDCGDQLEAAILAIAAAGGGILLYLQQEGRGIGLANKLRAYALQDQGFDTVDANLRLGFEVDERDFSLAANMLKALGVGAVRLLTNNPAKIAGLEAAGIVVEERLPLKAGEGAHNAAYLATKRDRTGHKL